MDITVILNREIKSKKLSLIFPCDEELKGTIDKNGNMFVCHPSDDGLVYPITEDDISWSSLEEDFGNIKRKCDLFDI